MDLGGGRVTAGMSGGLHMVLGGGEWVLDELVLGVLQRGWYFSNRTASLGLTTQSLGASNSTTSCFFLLSTSDDHPITSFCNLTGFIVASMFLSYSRFSCVSIS